MLFLSSQVRHNGSLLAGRPGWQTNICGACGEAWATHRVGCPLFVTRRWHECSPRTAHWRVTVFRAFLSRYWELFELLSTYSERQTFLPNFPLQEFSPRTKVCRVWIGTKNGTSCWSMKLHRRRNGADTFRCGVQELISQKEQSCYPRRGFTEQSYPEFQQPPPPPPPPPPRTLHQNIWRAANLRNNAAKSCGYFELLVWERFPFVADMKHVHEWNAIRQNGLRQHGFCNGKFKSF